MQIRELTQKKQIELEEGISSEIGDVAGQVVSGVKNVGSAIASPFKDIAQGYRTARQDQQVSVLADKAFRAWQKYVAQLEQSVAKQPDPVAQKKTEPPAATNATATPPAATNATATGAQKGQEVTLSKGDKYRFAGQQWVQVDPTTGAETGGAALPVGFQKSLTDLAAKQATTPAATAKTPPAATAKTPPAATAATPPAKPNYGTQTGAGAKVTYNQPTSAAAPTAPPVTQNYGTQTGAGAKVTATTPDKETEVDTLKELQAPVSPALAAFRDRTDGKYEAYLKAFVQKNLLAGLGFRGLVNQDEIDNAIKAIASPANADPAKQRPLWNDLARATSLAVPAAGALTGRDPKAPKDPNASKDPNAPATTEPGSDAAATTEPAKPTMTRDQISQWISRNSQDPAALKAALDAINAVKG